MGSSPTPYPYSKNSSFTGEYPDLNLTMTLSLTKRMPIRSTGVGHASSLTARRRAGVIKKDLGAHYVYVEKTGS